MTSEDIKHQFIIIIIIIIYIYIYIYIKKKKAKVKNPNESDITGWIDFTNKALFLKHQIVFIHLSLCRVSCGNSY